MGSPQGTRGRLGGVCYKHLCVFSHADHRPQGTDTPSRGEAGSGRGALVALGPRLGWGTAPRYLHRAHNQGTAPPQTTVAPRGSSHLSRRKDSSVASWGQGEPVGGVQPKASDSPGCIPPGPAFVMSCAGAAWGHTPALALGGSGWGRTVPSPGVAAPDPSCPQPTARASHPRAPSALSTRVLLPGH